MSKFSSKMSYVKIFKTQKKDTVKLDLRLAEQKIALTDGSHIIADNSTASAGWRISVNGIDQHKVECSLTSPANAIIGRYQERVIFFSDQTADFLRKNLYAKKLFYMKNEKVLPFYPQISIRRYFTVLPGLNFGVKNLENT